MKTSKIKLGIITLIAFCTIPIFSKAVDLDVGIEKEKVKINENGIIETKIPYNRNKDWWSELRGGHVIWEHLQGRKELL